MNAIGQKIDATYEYAQCAVIKYIYFENSGTVDQLNFNECEIERFEGVVRYKVNLDVNTQIKRISSIFDRYGFVICQGKSPGEANKKCDRVISYIKNNIIIRGTHES